MARLRTRQVEERSSGHVVLLSSQERMELRLRMAKGQTVGRRIVQSRLWTQLILLRCRLKAISTSSSALTSTHITPDKIRDKDTKRMAGILTPTNLRVPSFMTITNFTSLPASQLVIVR